jgi:hypothetical protein
MADLLPQIGTTATGPAEVEGDAGKVVAQPISALIAADRYQKAAAAMANPSRGLRITKLIPPGPIGGESSQVPGGDTGGFGF